VASRVQTAVTMRQVTGSMMNVVKGMDQAMKAMDLEKVCPSPFLHMTFRSIPAIHSGHGLWTRLIRFWTGRSPQ
jgi:hypothetical protein